MKTAFVCNVSERWKKKQSLLMEQIQRSVPEEKEIFLVDRTLPDSTEKHLQKIVLGKFDRIGIASGDGTVNRVLHFLFRHQLFEKFVLGIIPLGTCNDFARYLGLKAGKIQKAIEIIAANRTREISVAQVNGCAFFNNAGFGKKNPTAKRKNAVSVIREMEPVRVKINWQGEKAEGRFFMMLCANAPYFSGGLHFSKNSDPHDDELEFYFVKEQSKIRLGLALLLARAHVPLHFPASQKGILHVRSSKLSIETDRPVSIVADGEPIPELLQTTRATFELAGHCRFLVP